MPLPIPNLDDRTFDQLFRDARDRIARSSPQWTDLGPSDPGIVLLDVFAYLTDVMLYRLNRIPEKAFVAFLNLIGVHIYPPAAARVTLHFSHEPAPTQPLVIPRGTRVTLGRADGGGEPPVFQTVATATIDAGATGVDVDACHCDQVQAELAGYGTGLPGLSVTARRPPIVAPTGDGLDLIVGIEATPDELGERVPAIQYNGKTYRVWQEVPSFTNLGANRAVYMADRAAGLITFAPAARMQQPTGREPTRPSAAASVARGPGLDDVPQALADVPIAGREIRLWYWRGGGPEGNVGPATLTTLKDAITGVQVTNAQPASGGRAAESLANALVRGPQALHSLESVVTASDYERVSTDSSPGIARAKAFTRAAIWMFATPGTVEVLLVPEVPDAEIQNGRVTDDLLRQHQIESVRQQVQQTLDQRRALGTICLVNWAHYKAVRVSARIVVRREEDAQSVKERVTTRLNQTINPLPTALNSTGWVFGQALRASNVFDIALREPAVRWVDRVKLQVQEVPTRVNFLAADQFQASTWYASSESTLFRSLNDGESWEPVRVFSEGPIDRVRPHPERPGLLAVSTRLPDGSGSHVHVSDDCGETWSFPEQVLAFQVEDLAWTQRDTAPVLLLASDKGLYELVIGPNASPVQVLVDPDNQARPLYAATTARDLEGRVFVVVAAQSAGGLFLSYDGGPFRRIGLQGDDIRVLAVQRDGPRQFLWAGEAAPGGDDPGQGCFSWELLTGGADPPDGWHTYSNGWTGGSVRGIAFQGTTVLASSHHAGVLRIDAQAPNAAWHVPDIGCGLPLRDRERFLFQAVDTVATDPAGRLVMAGVVAPDAGGDAAAALHGIFRSSDGGEHYQRVSGNEFTEMVQLPATWLFCSAEHDIVVETEDAAG
jgi:Baseplate J-like protein